MSSSKLIAKENLTAFERWELPNVETPAESHSEEVDDAAELAELMTAEKLEEIHRQAYDEGFQSGRREGLQAAQSEVRAEVQRLHQIMKAFAEPLEDVDEQVEQELMHLVMAVARQFVRRELKSEPGEVVAVVRESLGALPAGSRKVKVYLHPQDAELVREHLAVAEGEDEESWRLVNEPTLTRGGCRIESEHSRIDASVESRLAAVAAELLGGERKDDPEQS